MSLNTDNNIVPGDDDEEDLEMLRLMALQSRKNKQVSQTSKPEQNVTSDNESDDSDSSVDSLDKLIQDMDYELLDTPKEERVYSKRKKTKRNKVKEQELTTHNKEHSIQELDKNSQQNKNENIVEQNKPDNDINLAAGKIETIGNRIPTLGEAPVKISNKIKSDHILKQIEPTLSQSAPKRSRSRSWSRDSIPYRRTRFSRSPERRSIFPDLTNVQLSPRALAFVYNNTGILIKRRDRRSSSSSLRDYSSDSSSRSRRSISPYPRSFKESSPQPSHSGQIHSFKTTRRSRSNSRLKARTEFCRQRFPNKIGSCRITRRPDFRDDGKKNHSRKESVVYQRNKQRSCSISLSPSPEPVTKQPMNFNRINYTGYKSRSRTPKFNLKQNNSSNNHTTKRFNSHKDIKINNTVQTEETKSKPSQNTNVEENSVNTNNGVTSNTIEVKQNSLETDDVTEDAIELTIDTSIEDVWSSESSDDEREGRFKTNTKETVTNNKTKISFSAKSSARPICVSLDEIVIKNDSLRDSQEYRKGSLKGSRMYRDNWEKKNRSSSRRSHISHERFKNNRHQRNINKYSKTCGDIKLPSVISTSSIVEKKSTEKSVESLDIKKIEPLKKIEASVKKSEFTTKKTEIPVKNNETSLVKVEPPKKLEEFTKTIISLKPKNIQQQKNISNQSKPIDTTDKKNSETIKLCKNNDTNSDLRDTLQQRRVKQVCPIKTQSSRLVQSALMGAVGSRTEAKRTDIKLQRNENNVENINRAKNSNVRHVLWLKSDQKQIKEESKQNEAKLPVRLRLGVSDSASSAARSSSNKKRKKYRGFVSKQSNEDLHQVLVNTNC